MQRLLDRKMPPERDYPFCSEEPTHRPNRGKYERHRHEAQWLLSKAVRGRRVRVANMPTANRTDHQTQKPGTKDEADNETE
jgi:hypothetical protein